MTKFIVLLIAATTCNVAMANDSPTLTFENSDGSQTSIAAPGLIITFSDGQLVGVNGDTTVTLDLNQLRKMYFGQATGIGSTTAANDGTTTIYTLGGVLIGKYPSFAEAKAQLQAGVYIVKTVNKTFKTTIK